MTDTPMFTGIIEGMGTIARIARSGAGLRLKIEADFDLDNVKTGDSIAVNGACLTAVNFDKRWFEVDVSPETVEKTTFSIIKPKQRVNLERALSLSSRIDGHLVSGHVDGTGRVKSINKKSNAIIIGFGIPKELSLYMIPKGSVAVDGVSLTINLCEDEYFEVSIIPHTASLTTIGFKKKGDPVNIETDMIGKYVKKFVSGNRDHEEKNSGSSLTMELLAKNGFL